MKISEAHTLLLCNEHVTWEESSVTYAMAGWDQLYRCT